MQTQEVGQWMRGRGCAVSLGVKPACSVLDVLFSESVIMVQLNLFVCRRKERSSMESGEIFISGFLTSGIESEPRGSYTSKT